MIVMKFGGSSVESASAMKRCISIIRDQILRRPVVVVSALGGATDALLAIAHHAARGNTYSAWKQLKYLQERHYEQAGSLLNGKSLEEVEQRFRVYFRELHLLSMELSEEGKELTPELTDFILSFGERMSSELLAAACNEAQVPAVHLDARKLILTDHKHTNASPLLWESYAKIRRATRWAALTRVAVLGGFIGSTEEGVTTTLGRGGSDLTASIVGAALNAEEVQIWTDVDGMLTTDPRLLNNVLRVKSLSYKEAAEMARAGAKVLQTHSVAPVIRQRIPLIIRNSRGPHIEGTRITGESEPSKDGVKSIACKDNLTVIELRSVEGQRGHISFLQELTEACKRASPVVEVCHDGSTIYLVVNGASSGYENLFDKDCCLEARVKGRRALISLVGQGLLENPSVAAKAKAVLKGFDSFLLPPDKSTQCTLCIVVPNEYAVRCVEKLHAEFFRDPDPEIFARCAEPQSVVTQKIVEMYSGSEPDYSRTRGVIRHRPGWAS